MQFLVSFLCISVAAAQTAPNPCTTAAPTPAPVVVTCSNFQCPAKMALKAEAVCAGGMCNVDTCCFENPCTTATTTLPTTVTTTPATTVTTTPAPTVTTTLPTTVTTTPQLTCADYKCPPKFALKAENVCPGNMCDAEVCCFESPCTTGTTTIPTTVTTTPATTVTTTPAPTVTTTLPTTVTTTPQVTCEDFKCPAKMALKADTVCAGGLCSADTCCFESPCTTGTTTIPTTVTTTPATTVTTTLPTTVTTTPQLTCADFKCPAKMALKADSVCAGGSCNADTCCFESPCTTMAPTPAPAPTLAPLPTPAPPTPPPAENPCLPQVTAAPARLFNAGEEVAALTKQEPKQENSVAKGWALPLIGAVAMLSFAAVIGMRRRLGRRDTRAVELRQSIAQSSDDEEAAIE